MQHPYPTPPRWRPPIGLIVTGAVLILIPVIGCGAWLWLQWAELAISNPWFVDTIRYSVFLLPVVLGAWAIGTAVSIAWRRWGWRESIYAHYEVLKTRAQVQVAPLATNFHYELNSESNASELPALPAPVDVTMPLDSWLRWVDEQPHVLLSGRTKAGKTHTATALLARRLRASEMVYIIDPHSSAWLGLPTVGFVGMRADGKPDTAALNAALLAVASEYISRMRARDEHKNATGTELPHDHFGRVTILIDEANYIADVLPTVWREFIKALASGGRKVGISLLCLAQSPLVEDIQISGSMRSNFARLALDDATVKQLIGSDEKDGERKKALHAALVGVERPAAATIDAQVWLLDRRGLEAGAAPSNAHTLVWSGKSSSVSPQNAPTEPLSHPAQIDNDVAGAVISPEAGVAPVATVALSAAEIANIASLLMTLPTSEVVKKVDGYNGRNYREIKQKVETVKNLIEGGK